MLIRHGETAGNQKQRYIGRRTDEPLLPQSQEVLKQLDYGEPQAVYASPMLRCTQTASILFPGKPLNIIDELAECDFGEFENKNYLELDGNANYIMNIMEEYADEERSFYDWHVKNGKGYEVEIDTELWKKERRSLHVVREL